MKLNTKRILFFITSMAVAFMLFSFSCNETTGNGTVFADNSPAVTIPQESLSVVEALQSAFRSVSNALLPTVVELNIVETKVVESNPFSDFFFFGQPNQDSEPQEYEQEGLGSGVIVRKNGNAYYVLTNNHVAGSAKEISVKLFDGTVYKGTLVGADDRKDIALVSFESKENIPVAKLGDSDLVKTGDICLAIGTPLGYYSSVTQGIVSATGRSGGGIGNISDFIQTDAAINQGNSGGPLVNIYGEVIGINTWIASQSGGSQGLGFSIPINNIKKAIDDFIKEGKVTYGWMGVSLVELKDEYLEDLGVAGKKGAFASQIFLDSPAEKAGMQAGDYVISLNGNAVKDVDQLVREVGDLTVGETAQFQVIRNKKEITLSVKIEGRDNAILSDNSKLWPGFIAYPLTDDIRKELEIEDEKVNGVVVTNIQSKSPAAALRLQQGDVITAVNGKEVSNLAEFYGALNTTQNKEIWFDVYNEGHTITTGRYKL